MCDHHHAARHILCRQCDLLVALPQLEHRQKAACPRCGTTLTTTWDAPRQRPTAYALVALFMLLLANLFHPGAGIDMSTLGTVDISKYQATAAEVQHEHAFIETILNLIPSNIFAALMRGEMLPTVRAGRADVRKRPAEADAVVAEAHEVEIVHADDAHADDAGEGVRLQQPGQGVLLQQFAQFESDAGHQSSSLAARACS